jgi:iron-sulfur cluster insertion protein
MNLTVTPSALEQIKLMLAHDFTLNDKVFRIQISGKGCDGFEYQLGFTEKRLDDIEIKIEDDLIILMDPFTQFYSSSATLDYIMDHVQNVDGFKFTNHNQTDHRKKFFKDTSKLPPWAKI